MANELCARLGIEFPLFAFSHCRDVVAAVSRAGGFGVLGATAFKRRLLRRAGWAVVNVNVGSEAWRALRSPPARIYHSISTGYAGILGVLLKHRNQRPFMLSEHGIYVKEHALELIARFRPDLKKAVADLRAQENYSPKNHLPK